MPHIGLLNAFMESRTKTSSFRIWGHECVLYFPCSIANISKLCGSWKLMVCELKSVNEWWLRNLVWREIEVESLNWCTMHSTTFFAPFLPCSANSRNSILMLGLIFFFDQWIRGTKENVTYLLEMPISSQRMTDSLFSFQGGGSH